MPVNWTTYCTHTGLSGGISRHDVGVISYPGVLPKGVLNLRSCIHKTTLVAAALSIICLCGRANAASQTISYPDFSSLAGLTLNGSAATINSGGPVFFNGQDVLRLTNDYSQNSSAFLTTAIPLVDSGGFKASFSTAFQFQITTPPNSFGDEDGSGADGICFVVQTASNTAGGTGGDIGYGSIPNSVGIEYDTFDNGPGYNDADGNHVGIDLNGSLASVAVQNVPDRMNDGDLWNSWVDYNGVTQLLEVRLAKNSDARPAAAYLSYNVDLATVLGQPNAFVGFTSGTGSGMGDHDIRSWTFTNTYAPISDVPEPGTLSLLLGIVPLIGTAVRRRK